MIAAGIILGLTYLGIAFARLPRINIDRPAAALSGAVLMLLTGILTFDEAVAAVDFNILALLLGMMLLVVVLQRGGFFTLLATRAVALTASPWRLMVAVVLATAVSSAFLVNDVVVLLFTPVVIQACRMQRVNPVPYLIGEAMASNIGSTATIVGNPQNMLIGVTSGISFTRFFAHLAPIAIAGTLILLAALWVFYGRRIGQHYPDRVLDPGRSGGVGTDANAHSEVAVDVQPRSLARSTPILFVTVLAFFFSSQLGLSIPLIAMTAGVAATVVSGVRPSQVIRSIDWVLLLFFGGLFVVIGGARHAGLLDLVLERVDIHATVAGITSVHLFSAVVSQIVSNVPLTMLLIPLLETVPGDLLWISLAAGATLGGNMTIIGAVANIIVAEQAHREGVLIRFSEFLRVGAVVTLLTIGASVGIIVVEFELGFLR